MTKQNAHKKKNPFIEKTTSTQQNEETLFMPPNEAALINELESPSSTAEAENLGEEENLAYEEDLEQQQFDEEFFEDEDQALAEVRDFSKNQVALNFSWSLMNQVRQMAKMEGVSVEDLLTELVAEGVAKRVFEDQSRPIPSHLMTRTGYLHSDSEHNPPQPQLSHHAINNNRQQTNNNPQNRNRFKPQQKNGPQNRDNRGYHQNNGTNNNNRPQNNSTGFRGQYGNNQQRFSRNNNSPNSSGNSANSNNSNGNSNNYQSNANRPYDDNSQPQQNGNNSQYKPRTCNKR